MAVAAARPLIEGPITVLDLLNLLDDLYLLDDLPDDLHFDLLDDRVCGEVGRLVGHGHLEIRLRLLPLCHQGSCALLLGRRQLRRSPGGELGRLGLHLLLLYGDQPRGLRLGLQGRLPQRRRLLPLSLCKQFHLGCRHAGLNSLVPLPLGLALRLPERLLLVLLGGSQRYLTLLIQRRLRLLQLRLGPLCRLPQRHCLVLCGGLVSRRIRLLDGGRKLRRLGRLTLALRPLGAIGLSLQRLALALQAHHPRLETLHLHPRPSKDLLWQPLELLSQDRILGSEPIVAADVGVRGSRRRRVHSPPRLGGLRPAGGGRRPAVVV